MERKPRLDRPELWRIKDDELEMAFDQLVGFDPVIQVNRDRAIELGWVDEDQVPETQCFYDDWIEEELEYNQRRLKKLRKETAFPLRKKPDSTG